MNTTKRITIATIKSFVRKNADRMMINVKGSFSGYTDCVESLNAGWQKAETGNPVNQAYTLGIDGAWFVGDSRDYFRAYEDESRVGYEVYNSCGKFILAVAK
jgi:hypothetical protein